jgi:hypothetical protein
MKYFLILLALAGQASLANAMLANKVPPRIWRVSYPAKNVTRIVVNVPLQGWTPMVHGHVKGVTSDSYQIIPQIQSRYLTGTAGAFALVALHDYKNPVTVSIGYSSDPTASVYKRVIGGGNGALNYWPVFDIYSGKNIWIFWKSTKNTGKLDIINSW